MQKTLEGHFNVAPVMFFGSAHIFSMGSAWTSNLSTGDSRYDIGFSPKCQNNAENVRAERFFSLLKLPINGQTCQTLQKSTRVIHYRIYAGPTACKTILVMEVPVSILATRMGGAERPV